MTQRSNEILTVAQMRAAEEALVDAGSSVDALMQVAGRGAAEWIYRLGWPGPVTVLCGPGNNGGDGYVIAQALRERHVPVVVLAPLDPATDAARNARAGYGGDIWTSAQLPHGAVLVDCLFGSGLARPLSGELAALLAGLAATHPRKVAVDVPSGIESDSGQLLNQTLPSYDLTIALGAWKFAHWTMPASALMGERRLVGIGTEPLAEAAQLLGKPRLSAPLPGTHKYTRGLVAIVSGRMPGASQLAGTAAMHSGAGYVKLVAASLPSGAPAELVTDPDVLSDPRLSALLAGPGLGRDGAAFDLLKKAVSLRVPLVLDADALMLLAPEMLEDRGDHAMIATPHEGELTALAGAWSISASGKLAIAKQLAEASGMVILAKGPDTVIAAPDGRVAIAPPATSWLSTAGTGDVLAGLVVGRLATDGDPFQAACESVWLHGEAARLSGSAFAAGDLVRHIPAAITACL